MKKSLSPLNPFGRHVCLPPAPESPYAATPSPAGTVCDGGENRATDNLPDGDPSCEDVSGSDLEPDKTLVPTLASISTSELEP